MLISLTGLGRLEVVRRLSKVRKILRKHCFKVGKSYSDLFIFEKILKL